MHYKFFVLLKKEEAKTSQEAREHAYDYLCQNDFSNQECRFSGGVCDWFVIGGRWSGELTCLQSKDKINLYKAIFKLLKLKKTDSLTEDIVQQNKNKLQALWEKLSKTKTLNPYLRNTYLHIGYEDDAMILDKQLFDKLKKEKVFFGDFYNGNGIVDISDDYTEKLDKSMVGKYWLIVGDFHN